MRTIAKALIITLTPVLAIAGYQLQVIDMTNNGSIYKWDFDENGVLEKPVDASLTYNSNYNDKGEAIETETCGLGLSFKFEPQDPEGSASSFNYIFEYTEIKKWDKYPTHNGAVVLPQLSKSTLNSTITELNEWVVLFKPPEDPRNVSDNFSPEVLFKFKVIKK